MRATKRPIGVSVIALLALACAIPFIVVAVLSAAAPHILAPFGFKLDPQPLARLFGIGFFSFVGALLAHTAYCLWTLRAWGRSFASGVAYGGLVAIIVDLIHGSADPVTAGPLAAGCLALLWYLSRAQVRSTFSPEFE